MSVFFSRNLNGNLIFRDENGNIILSFSCFETRTRNRKLFLKVEQEKMKLIFAGIPGNKNSRHCLVEQWSPVAQEVPTWTNGFLTSFSSIELSCTKPRRRKDPEGRKPTPIFLALRDLLGKLSGPILKSHFQICLFQKARH